MNKPGNIDWTSAWRNARSIYASSGTSSGWQTISYSRMMRTAARDNLVQGVIRSMEVYPDRPALEVDGRVLTYTQLGSLAGGLAATIARYDSPPRALAAFLAQRSLTGYAAMLGILMAGKGYVPLHPRLPAARARQMLRASGVGILIAAAEAMAGIESLLEGIEDPLTVICPDTQDLGNLARDLPHHRFVTAGELAKADGHPDGPAADPDSIAYVMFTSGSTGEPKGVPVSQRNVTAYLKYMCAHCDVQCQDRFAQTADLTFDLSIHPIFVCWWGGACLCSVPQHEAMAPASFIKKNRVTMWCSVPSVIMFMSKMRLLKPGAFPTLRHSVFCGEPLPATWVIEWRRAACHSTVDNLYGPTEATVAISQYRWDDGMSPPQCLNGIVPIGTIFPEQHGCVIDDGLCPVPSGQPGELCLAGTQVTRGYLNNPEQTHSQYVTLESRPGQTWYRTGDVVKTDEQGCLYYLGRIDNQVQVLGHRVELQEVEHVLRQAAKTDMVVAVPWPFKDGRADGLYAFVCPDGTVAERQLLQACKAELPDYMVPRKIFFCEDLPLNPNGKVDRKLLAGRLARIIQG